MTVRVAGRITAAEVRDWLGRSTSTGCPLDPARALAVLRGVLGDALASSAAIQTS